MSTVVAAGSAFAASAARPWLQHYPAGVPADIDWSRYRSCVELFDEAIAQFRTRDAFVCMDKRITYDQLDRMATQVAAWLQASGLERGARVAIMMPNVLQYPIAILGTLRAGCTVVNVNPLYTPRELEHQLKDSGAEAIVVLENFAATLEQVRREDEDPACRRHLGHRRPVRLPEGPDRQLRGAQREEDGAGLRSAECDAFQRDAGRGREAHALSSRSTLGPRGRRFPAVHRRHHRRVEGRDAAPSQRDRQRAAVRSVDAAADSRTATRPSRSWWSARCRCITSSR